MLEFKPRETKKVNVRVQGANPLTEVYIIDSKFALKESFAGSGETKLDSGTYTFRFQEGEFARDQTVFVDEDTFVKDPNFEPLNEFAKALGRLKFNIPDVEFAHSRAYNLISDVGEVPALFSPSTVPMLEELILNKNTDEKPDIKESKLVWRIVGKKALESEHSNSCLLVVELLFEGKSYYLEVVTATGFKLHIQVENADDLSSLTLSMVREEEFDSIRFYDTFASDKHGLALSKLAMQALSNKRSIVSKQALSILTNSKWQLPWHGVLAIHLQVLKPNPDVDLIKQMIVNLQRLFDYADHPDIVAIKWWLHINGDAHQPLPAPIKHAPLLRYSWLHLLTAASAYREKVIPQVFAHQVECRFVSQGPWIYLDKKENTERHSATLRNVLQQSICEYLIDECPKVPIYTKNDTSSLTISKFVFRAIQERKGSATEENKPLWHLCESIYSGEELKSNGTQTIDSEFYTCIESTAFVQHITLCTGHSLNFLLSSFDVEVVQNQIHVTNSNHGSGEATM